MSDVIVVFSLRNEIPGFSTLDECGRLNLNLNCLCFGS